MKRRAFLKTASTAFPLAALTPFSLTQAPATVPLHPVTAGQDRFGEFHSRGTGTMLFKLASTETAGDLFIMENIDMTKGGPPLHLHHLQDEWFYVIDGEVLFQLGETRIHLKAGDSVLGPRGIPHALAYIGEKPGRMLVAYSPAGKIEAFFRATAIPNPPKQDAEFFRKYDMELLGPPLSTT